jgi:hypothetical protein
MLRTLLLLTATAVVVLAGVVHGYRTDRWGTSPDLQRAVDNLSRVPLALGDWQGQDDPEKLDARQVERGQLAGYLSRRYVNRLNGSEVKILLMCGRPGPISVHTPDICFQGIGYELLGEEKYPPGATAPEMKMGRFRLTETPAPQHLCTLWSWNADGTWQVPDNPRLAFVRFPALYKLYVICDMPAGEGLRTEDPRAQFVRLLLPELNRDLFGGTESPPPRPPK